MAGSKEEIQKSKKLYLIIFGALLFCTGLTVAVATVEALDFGGHGFDAADAVIGLFIASLKATLVAAIFMHLNHEKKLICGIFYSTLTLCVVMFLLLLLAYNSPIFDSFFYL